MEGVPPPGQAQENNEKHFHWRDYLCKPELMSKSSADKLDLLAALLEHDPEGSQFMIAMQKGAYKNQPIQAFVHFFRDVLSPAERSQLIDDINGCTPSGYRIDRDCIR